MITPAQSRAARALVNWSQPALAAASGASISTIRDFETGKRSPIANNLAAIRKALEDAGVIFVAENGEGPGVRLRKKAGSLMQKKFEIGDRVKQHDSLPVDRHAGEVGVVIDPGRILQSADNICVRWPDGEECEYGGGRFVLISKALQTDETNASNDD